MFGRLLTGLQLLVCLTACTLNPAVRSDKLARQLGFDRLVLTGAGYRHVVYRNRVTDSAGVLHVYLEGDGSPWINERRVASDPGPRNPLMLQLMAIDRAPSVYLGRPCYHGLAADPGCNPLLWTTGRYSPRVITSMTRVLAAATRVTHSKRLVLIGYSGGGAIAMLMAAQVPDVVAVVTLAGNLDPDKWAKLHDYSELASSLNPTQQPPLVARIYQLHVAAERDDVVPPSLVISAASHQQHADTLIIPDADHTCCWQSLWPALLAAVADRVALAPVRQKTMPQHD